MSEVFYWKWKLESGFTPDMFTVGENYTLELWMFAPNGPDGIHRRPNRMEQIAELEWVRVTQDLWEILIIEVSDFTKQTFDTLNNLWCGWPFLLENK